MSGHYIVYNIDRNELKEAQGPPLNAQWSDLQHENVGWNTESRAVLARVMKNEAIGNRAGLPPHRYLQIGGQNPVQQEVAAYLRYASWVKRLRLPTSAGLGLTALSQAARTAWDVEAARPNEEDRNWVNSLICQIEAGAVSIEIYYRDALDMV